MLKFGFGAVPEATLGHARYLVRLGEQLGYDVAWMPDQTFFRDPFVLLTVFAMETERIELRLGVTNPYTRHPALVARASATIDELSGARFSLAYGAGNRKELLLPLGMEQSEAGPRCREAVVVSKQLLAGETVHYRSDTLVVDGVTLLTPPRPDLRVYLAGRGPYILKAAGEVADGAIIGGLVSPSGISYALQMVRDGARSKGRDAGKMDMIWWGSCYLTDDRQAIVDQLKSSVAHIIGGAPISVLQTIGLSDGRIDQLKKKYVAEGPAGAATLVTEEEIDLFSIVGDGKECSDKIAGLEKAGINQIGLLLNQPTAEAQQSFLRQFASEVIPYFR